MHTFVEKGFCTIVILSMAQDGGLLLRRRIISFPKFILKRAELCLALHTKEENLAGPLKLQYQRVL